MLDRAKVRDYDISCSKSKHYLLGYDGRLYLTTAAQIREITKFYHQYLYEDNVLLRSYCKQFLFGPIFSKLKADFRLYLFKILIFNAIIVRKISFAMGLIHRMEVIVNNN